MTEVEWTEVKLPNGEEADDIIWVKYDYLWVKAGNKLYLSRDCGDTFARASVLEFAFTNIRHMAIRFLKRCL